jgi:hypothetical protein
MKTLQRIVISIVSSLLICSCIYPRQPLVLQREEGLLDRLLGDVSIKQHNVPVALYDIADKYNIPIGVEVSSEDDPQKDGNISVQINGGTLRDVLNSIVSQNPIYTWDVEDGVINVYPRGNRDPLLQTLLEAKIQAFSVEKKTSRFKFREDLTKRPELKGVLDSYGVTPVNEIFGGRDIAVLGGNFSLNVSDMKVKSILNRVIRDSQTKYWIIDRYGPNRQYLLLNL